MENRASSKSQSNLPEENRYGKMQQKSISVFYLAAFFGLVAGFGRVFVFAFEKVVLRHYIHQSPNVVWIALVANVLFFMLVAIFFWLLAHLWSQIMPRWLPVFVFALMCYFNLLKLADWLNNIPLAILAIGLATETAHLVNDHPERFYFLVRRSIGWIGLFSTRKAEKKRDSVPAPLEYPQLTRRQFLLSTGIVLAGSTLGTLGKQKLGEMLAFAQLPPSSHHVPNVLLIVLDTVRAQNLSIYGYERMTTPNLARLAKNGVLFETAIATSSWTLPSHGGLFTGHYAHELSTNYKTPLDSKYPTLAEVLSRQGYETAGFVANKEYASSESGLGRGFAVYKDYDVSLQDFLSNCPSSNSLAANLRKIANMTDVTEKRSLIYSRTASEINGEFLRWIENKSSRPFFVFLNYMDAHYPYLSPESYKSMFGSTNSDPFLPEKWLERPQEISREYLELVTNAYDGAIAYLDHEVGLLLDELEKRKILEETLVIIVSDHGEEFCEHGEYGHGGNLYFALLHVPLLIRYPKRVPTGKRVKAVTSLGDIASTIIDLTNSADEVKFPGRSLARYWKNASEMSDLTDGTSFSSLKYMNEVPQRWRLAKGDMQSLVSDDFHYIRNGDGREELYNWLADSSEQTDLSETVEGQSRLAQLRTMLKTFTTG